MSVVDTLVTVGVVGAAGFICYELLQKSGKVPGLPSLPSLPASITPTNVLSSDICSQIAFWRQNVAPGLLGTGFGGANPNDWTAFRGWMIGTFGVGDDPGPNWPDCWTGRSPGTPGGLGT